VRLPHRLTLLAVAAVALGACGSDAGGGAATGGGGHATVSVREVTGIGAVLVDHGGGALYTPDQEAGGTIHCTGACTQFWIPLERGPAAPAAAPGVTGRLSAVTRPDGVRQVTYDGMPLYRFSQDGTSGKVTGDGVRDAFGGRRFTWHAVTAGAHAPAATPSSTRQPGGYGY
jgi:predicted lipoprotein with Yx(FWY)xxD motif